MAFDYKKEYKEFYMPKDTPAIVTVPKMNYICLLYTSLGPVTIRRSKSFPKVISMGTTFFLSRRGWRPLRMNSVIFSPRR